MIFFVFICVDVVYCVFLVGWLLIGFMFLLFCSGYIVVDFNE